MIYLFNYKAELKNLLYKSGLSLATLEELGNFSAAIGRSHESLIVYEPVTDIFNPFVTKGFTQNVLKKTVFSCDVTGGITCETKLKIPNFTLYLPLNIQSRVFWYFKSLCNKDTVSNKNYQYFRDKRLVRPGIKHTN